MHRILAAALALSAACVTSTDAEDNDLTQPLTTRCEALEGRRFTTVELQTDCGPAPAGSNIECRWSIYATELDANTTRLNVHVSDTGESVNARCIDNEIVDEFDRVRGTYDANADRITWNGVVYAP